jgi:hypothetical protein
MSRSVVKATTEETSPPMVNATRDETAPPVAGMYLDLIERCLLGLIYEDAPQDPWSGGLFKPELRNQGLDWPSAAHTMIGTVRLHALRLMCEHVLLAGIPGDFIETGVWRGGASILMRAVLKVHGVIDRTVWCADSFEGLPAPDDHYPQDAGDLHHTFSALAVSLEDVKGNFEKYGLLDSQVRFLKGWFKDTLPTAAVDRLSILRLDGDMYQSTMDALQALYDKLSPGGFVVVDDFGAVPACKQAIFDFRMARHIQDELKPIDRIGAFWQKSA